MYRGWTQIEYQNKHYNINKRTKEQEDRGRDEGTDFILRIKEQETRRTLHEHDDDYETFTIGLRIWALYLLLEGDQQQHVRLL